MRLRLVLRRLDVTISSELHFVDAGGPAPAGLDLVFIDICGGRQLPVGKKDLPCCKGQWSLLQARSRRRAPRSIFGGGVRHMLMQISPLGDL